MKQQLWHTLTTEKIFQSLETSESGLLHSEVRIRLEEGGSNTLPEGSPTSLLSIFLSQFQSPLIYTLLGASVLVYITGDAVDASIVLGVLLFNAVVGAFQEGRAQNTLLALKKYVETRAIVLRDSKEYIVKDSEVVPGDILILNEGEKIPADARIIESQGLKLDEASLTGESDTVNKVIDAISWEGAPTPEQKNMVFKGTYIVSGNGKAVVVATGVETVIGKIAKEISVIDTEIPLKKSIKKLSQFILAAVGIIGVFVFLIGISSGNSAATMFGVVVSLAVSVIPEGLPIVMTIILASGVWRMSKQNALVKKLQAVEALGQARILAVDKTGTITKNELVVREVWLPGEKFEVRGIGYESLGEFYKQGVRVSPADHKSLLFAGKLTALLARARVSFSEEQKRWFVTGDPTEAAMLVLGEKLGFLKDPLLSEHPLLAEIPFDYRLKVHATIHKDGAQGLLTVIGAPEAVIDRCTMVLEDGIKVPLSEKSKTLMQEGVRELSQKGLRVVAIGYKETQESFLLESSLEEICFVGFLGMQDTLRPEVHSAMNRAREAGIKVVMITGDHAITAESIAREAGIYREGDGVLTGLEIDAMSDTDLARVLYRITVFARVTPEHKMRIIKAYKVRGEVVAMTGDGVNDAPSLVAADLGVAMGNIGTEVAKEAADIVLLDDNFGSVIAAVEEGRGIYRTIKRVILYLFSTSLGEVLVITGALLLGYPLPLLAAQIIWLNFVTDGFLVVALPMDPKEGDLLISKTPPSQKYLLDGVMVRRMIVMALPMTIGTLVLFSFYLESDPLKATTISLTALAVFQWFNAWNCRSEYESVFTSNPFSNKFLLGATGIVVLLQIAAVYVPSLQKILHTVPLNQSDWILVLGVASSIIFVEEIRKFFSRRQRNSAA
jgi:Ca2+-transporting ATPase